MPAIDPSAHPFRWFVFRWDTDTYRLGIACQLPNGDRVAWSEGNVTTYPRALWAGHVIKMVPVGWYDPAPATEAN